MFSKQVDDEVRTAPQKSNPKKKCDDLLNVSLRLTRNVEVVGSSPIKGPRCFLEQDTLPLVLVGSKNRFERDITIELK